MAVTDAAHPPIRRLGVFGGAFDPPHDAHVALARAAVEQLQLDELRIFPTGQAWHKPQRLSPAADRLAMAQLAFAGVPRAVVDGRETLRDGPTYTVDTLRELQAEFVHAQIWLVLGADQAQALPGWHEWEEVLRIAIISIAGRDRSTANADDFSLPGAPRARLVHLEMPPLPVSATDIRRRAAASQGVDHLVPAAVARYIDQHHLYRIA